MFNLDDLPDFLLVEILCRIPQKSAVQCKSVSKRWYRLVSDPYFVGRFLRLQSDNQMPINTFLLFTNPTNKRKFFYSMLKEPAKTSNVSLLSFLPCFQGHLVNTRGGQPVVVGEYNDLLLCCATTWFQRDYYICNPYTMQWEALPPPPQCHRSVRVGFLCDPYYNTNTSTSTIFQPNAEYRYSVVRLIPGNGNSSSFRFKAEIFSSQTGKWTESVVLSPRSFCFDELACNAGVACNGMLYWWSDGFIIGLDPYSNSNNSSSTGTGDQIHNKYYFRLIDKPENDNGYIDMVGVCKGEGRLQMCLLGSSGVMNFWDFKDDQVVDSAAAAGKWCLVGSTSLYPLLLETWTRERRWVDKIMGLAFDPIDKDVFYLEWDQNIYLFHIRSGLLWEMWKTPRSYSPILFGRVAFPVSIPWWPTPVTRHKWTSSSSNRAAEEHGGPRTRSLTRKRPHSQRRITAADFLLKKRKVQFEL